MENKCKKCGKLNEGEAQFCNNCGASFSAGSQLIKNADKNYETPNITPVKQDSVITNKTKGRSKQIAKVAKIIVSLLITFLFFSFLVGTDDRISTEDARKVYDNMNDKASPAYDIFCDNAWKASIKSGKVRINKFKKTNGQSGKGVYIFEYSAEAEVLKAIKKTSPYVSVCTYEKGEIIQEEGTLRFEMTERGWRGEDGNIY